MHWLVDLDKQPTPLLKWLADRPTARLGVYYERLWQFALHHAPDIELLAANLVLYDGSRTLGEMDLLLQLPENTVHIELAVKFYLGVANATDAQWIGPNGKDRLDIKLGRLLNHQLPLSQSTAGQHALKPWRTLAPVSFAWIAGYLFYPWSAPCRPPSTAGVSHAHGLWLHQRQWPTFCQTQPQDYWQRLPRLNWLAPARVNAEQLLTPEPINTLLEQQPLQAHLVARLAISPEGVGHEVQRVFIVPDEWPTI